ncbi:MAG: transposase [Flavobacteriales bacterium]
MWRTCRFACIDNLSGFSEAIALVYRQSDIQLLHRASVRGHLEVRELHNKEVVKDMRAIYRAPNEERALQALEVFSDKWGALSASSELPAHQLAAAGQPVPVQRAHPLLDLHDQSHRGLPRAALKYTKTKRVFENDMALLKLLYLAQQRIVEKMAAKPIFAWRETLPSYACSSVRASIHSWPTTINMLSVSPAPR